MATIKITIDEKTAAGLLMLREKVLEGEGAQEKRQMHLGKVAFDILEGAVMDRFQSIFGVELATFVRRNRGIRYSRAFRRLK